MLIHVPDKIGNAQTLFIAETDGFFNIVERKKERIEIVYLAVCKYYTEDGYYLFGCDREFVSHTDFYYDNLEEALDDARRIYDIKRISWREYLPVMAFADTVEIYLSVIDGAQVWFPVMAKLLADNQYLLLYNNYFDCTDYSILPEFIPGDTVSVLDQSFHTVGIKKKANKLVAKSKHPDKLFFEFLYESVTGNLQQNRMTFDKFQNEITRVIAESAEGEYFYPGIIEVVDSFERAKYMT